MHVRILIFADTSADISKCRESLLTEIVLINPYLDKDTPRDKQSILDIRAKTDQGELNAVV